MAKPGKEKGDISAFSKEDSRIGELVCREPEADRDMKVVMVGFPSDEGVRRNNGRTGAAAAPDVIREALYKMTPDAESPAEHAALFGQTMDLGNIEISGELEDDQQALGQALRPHLEKGAVPVILGGGHETAFGHFLGYAEAGLKTSILNLDAHTDVRPLREGCAHSGSPFRQALEHSSGCCETYMVAGLQPHSVSGAHRDYVLGRQGRCLFRDETNITSISGLFHEHDSERLMVTFDMDAVDQAFAPGVSAPCTNGLHPDLWLTAAYLAGRNEKTSSFDISEVNPAFDRDGQTSRLAALTVWHFLLGLSQRP